MDARLHPTVAHILEELRGRPKGAKKMSARRVLRAFGYERRSRENVVEICEQFRRARIQVVLSLTEPASLDHQVLLQLEEAARTPAATPAPDPNPHGPRPLPRPGHLAGNGHGNIADVIAAVKRCTVQVFTEVGGGSGVIVDPDGLILTCRHVVAREDALSERHVRVDLWDGSHEIATVVRSHRSLDFALLVVPRGNLPAIPLGDSLGLREAETLYIIGSPAGLTNSVSRGIVSSPGRSCTTNVEYIQTDAAINAGNSGGPAVTERGDLVGISTWAYHGEGGTTAQGINFAIPVDYLVDEIEIVRQLGLEEACRRAYCRHCGWMQSASPRYCENCGAMFVEKILEGNAA